LENKVILGGSAPFYAREIARIVENVLLWKPLSSIKDDPEQWRDLICYNCDMLQNERNSTLFKIIETNKSYFLDAIIFQGKEDWDSFTGIIEDIESKQYVNFPFTEKRFYIDIVEDKNGHKTIKDKNQLIEPALYYDMLSSEKLDKHKQFIISKLRERKLEKILKKY